MTPIACIAKNFAAPASSYGTPLAKTSSSWKSPKVVNVRINTAYVVMGLHRAEAPLMATLPRETAGLALIGEHLARLREIVSTQD